MLRQARLSVFSQTAECCDKAYYVNLHIGEVIAFILNYLSPASFFCSRMDSCFGKNNIIG